MDKRFWVAAFSLGVSLLSSACSEVDHCEKGALGCQGGPCDTGDACELDLDCVQLTSSKVCGKVQASGKIDCGDVDCTNGTIIGGDGDGPVPCNCPNPTDLCVPGTSDQCINYCVDPGTVPVATRRSAGEVLPCRLDDTGQPVTYANACKALWKQFCLRAPVYCPGYVCDPTYYASQEAQDWCMQFYPELNNLAGYCETLRDSTCENFTECVDPTPDDPNGFPKNCANPGVCNRTCEYANDGACDDGDISTAAYGVCAFGSDCGDCGPRTGQGPTLPLKIGDLCVGHEQCAGYNEDLRNNKAWCLSVGDTGVFRCMADCTLDDICGEGYKCTTLVDDAGEPIAQGSLEAKVCDPQICN